MKRFQSQSAHHVLSKAYAVQQILHEQYLWIISRSKRPSWLYIKYDAIRQLEQRMIQNAHNTWTYNCKHCQLCRQLFAKQQTVTMRQVISAVIQARFRAQPHIIHISQKFYQ